MDINSIPVAEDVYLGCNPYANPDATGRMGWPQRTGRTYDIADADYSEDDGWDLGCHFPEPPGPHRPKFRVGPGTRGWIVRFENPSVHIAGLMVFDGRWSTERERVGAKPVLYGVGTVCPLLRGMWISGDDIANHGGWSGARPFNPDPKKPKRGTNGECWLPGDVQVLRDLLDPMARAWLDLASAKLAATGMTVKVSPTTLKPLKPVRGRRNPPQYLHLAS